jgi:hypothetical protein
MNGLRPLNIKRVGTIRQHLAAQKGKISHCTTLLRGDVRVNRN